MLWDHTDTAVVGTAYCVVTGQHSAHMTVSGQVA